MVASVSPMPLDAAPTVVPITGISGETIHRVFTTSNAGCNAVVATLTNIIDRNFTNSGSHITTMYKDLAIVLDMARELDVPLFTVSCAMQFFQAGKSKYPDGDNWIITRVLEDISGSQLHNGRATRTPATESLRCYPVKIENGRVFIGIEK